MTTPAAAVQADPVALQVARDNYAAGFRGSALVRSVAIVLQESGGLASATRRVFSPPPGYSPEFAVGKWQINLLAHGNNITEGAARTTQGDAFAFGLYQGAGNSFRRDWRDADAALDGQGTPDQLAAARDAQQRAGRAVAALGIAAAQNQPTAAAGGQSEPSGTQQVGFFDGVAQAGEFFGKAGDTLTAITARGFWPRVGLTAAALGMIVIGGALYFRVPQTVAKDAAKAAPAAAAAA